MCSYYGRCTAVEGRCEVGGDDDCKLSEVCKRFGQCVSQGDSCVVGNSGDTCKDLRICKRFGWCTQIGGQCRAASSEDCAESLGCKNDGKCVFRDGICSK